jgi:hypothetical protein
LRIKEAQAQTTNTGGLMPLGPYEISFNFQTKDLEEFTDILEGPADPDVHDKAHEMLQEFRAGTIPANHKSWRKFVKEYVKRVDGPEEGKDYKENLWRDALVIPAAFEIFWRLFCLSRDHSGPTFRGLGDEQTRSGSEEEPRSRRGDGRHPPMDQRQGEQLSAKPGDR